MQGGVCKASQNKCLPSQTGARNKTSARQTGSRKRKNELKEGHSPSQRMNAATFFIRNSNKNDNTARLTPLGPNMLGDDSFGLQRTEI